MEDKQKFQIEGLRWLHELEFINHPQVVNNIKLNILTVSNRIKEVELLIYREKKSILVLLELSWIGRKFFKKQIIADVHEVLQQLLPSFRFRVIDEPEIMNLAISKVKQAITGGKNETTSTNINGSTEHSTPESRSSTESDPESSVK